MRHATLLLLLPLAACGNSDRRDDAGTATRSFPASGFNRIDLGTSDNVTVHSGGAFAVTATGDPELLDRLQVDVADGVLRIAHKRQTSWNWSTRRGLRLSVTMPRFTGARVAGSGNIDADRGTGDFHGDVSGSGNLHVAALDSSRAAFDVRGSGSVVAGGRASALEASIRGSGSVHAEKLTARDAIVSVSGSGNLNATVTGDARIVVRGSGNVMLHGGARCTIESSGSGKARCD